MGSSKGLLIICIFVLLSACAAPPVSVHLNSAPHLNPNQQAQSLPVLVKIYELTDKTQFENASFRQIWKNDVNTLGDSLLNHKEVYLQPNSKTKVKIPHSKGGKYIAVAAIYRNPNQGNWRMVKRLPYAIASLWSSVKFELRGNSLHG